MLRENTTALVLFISCTVSSPSHALAYSSLHFIYYHGIQTDMKPNRKQRIATVFFSSALYQSKSSYLNLWHFSCKCTLIVHKPFRKQAFLQYIVSAYQYTGKAEIPDSIGLRATWACDISPTLQENKQTKNNNKNNKKYPTCYLDFSVRPFCFFNNSEMIEILIWHSNFYFWPKCHFPPYGSQPLICPQCCQHSDFLDGCMIATLQGH